MTAESEKRTRHGWEIVEDNGGTATIRCPDCGTENSAVKQTAVFSGRVTCRECGNSKEIGSPNGAIVLAVFLAAAIIAPLYFQYQRLKGWILDGE